MDEDALYEYQIPSNILESKRILGFRRRNWIEGIICVFIVGFIICLIPFVARVKLIFLAILCSSVLLLNLIGIKDQSLFEVLTNFSRALKQSGTYHLRRLDNEKRANRAAGMAESLGGAGNGDSAADKILEIDKKKLDEFRGTR